MNYIDSAPTAADYASAAVQDQQIRIRGLEARIIFLEDIMLALLNSLRGEVPISLQLSVKQAIERRRNPQPKKRVYKGETAAEVARRESNELR